MLFNSLEFAVFFPVVTVLYFLAPQRFRWMLLLGASCVFYMAFIPAYIFILFFLIVIDYSAALAIERSEGKRRKAFLAASIVSTCVVLFVFKYLGFFVWNAAAVARALHLHYPMPIIRVILPVGLSFHTFQSLSYVIEVYRGRFKAERHFGIYALYVMFFPQLVAGPIERPQNLLPQFYERHSFDYRRVTGGLKLMAWGFFQKIVVADRVALFVNQVYGGVSHYPPVTLVMATVFFAVQVYCDFAGYSNIAIGCAEVLGFRLTKNFDRPYAARSVVEYYRRWHITFVTWLRDYIYIPLGGNRKGTARMYLNILIVFAVSGLWHGAKWTYVTWGLLHGCYWITGDATKNLRARVRAAVGIERFPRLLHAFQTTVTFSLICFGYIFFRSDSLKTAFYIVGQIFSVSALGITIKDFAANGWLQPFLLGQSRISLAAALAAIAILEFVQWFGRRGALRGRIAAWPALLRWPVYYGWVLVMMFLGIYGKNQFIYFQF